ncbi:glycosyltransferase [Phascolarctobacterium faecium]|uniref:glycosyltransferase n=1 Tax=Phascolarctobacterium faecium TaxID=33025 RepID=UPI003521107E
MKSDFPKWKVEFWGDIEYDKNYYKECLNLLKKYNCSEVIFFCGTTNDVLVKLKSSDIFAFPSAFEGFSLALTEAMSVGLPVIGYRSCPSVNTIIVDGYNGLLCDDGVESMSDRLAILMSDYKLRAEMGTNAHKSISGFAAPIVLDQWERLLNRFFCN